jgi:hypothetical protein
MESPVYDGHARGRDGSYLIGIARLLESCNTPGVYILLDNECGFKHVISVDKTDAEF